MNMVMVCMEILVKKYVGGCRTKWFGKQVVLMKIEKTWLKTF